MKKVLLVVTRADWGGAQRYVYDLCNSSLSEQFDLTVAVGSDGRLLEKLAELNIKTVRIGFLKRAPNPLWDLLASISLLRLILRIRPSILHLNSSKTVVLGVLLGRILGVNKIVLTSHGWPFFETLSSFRRVIYRSLIWIAVFFAHNVITVSRADFKAAENFQLNKRKRVSLIHNGIKVDEEHMCRSQARAYIFDNLVPEASKESCWVAVIGELTKNKGQKLLVDLFDKQLPKNAELFIIGDGEDRGSLIDTILDSKNCRHIHLTGSVPDSRSIMKAFDIVVVPSEKEGLPYVILEAGAARIPVVASSVGGITDIISDRENGLLLTSFDLETWGHHLTELLLDPKLRVYLGENLHKTVAINFSLEVMIDKVRLIYDH